MNGIEHTYFVDCSSDIIVKAIVFAAILAVFVFFREKFEFELGAKAERIIECVFLAVIFLISLVWVLVIRSNAVSDQLNVMNAAVGLKRGDYSEFLPGGYVYRITYQSGLVLIHYIMAHIFGDFNYLPFQILSVVSVTLTWKQLYDIAKMAGAKCIWRILLLFAGVLFLPYTFYSTFVYGTVIGFALAITAIKYELLFIKDEKWKDIVISATLITLSIIFKSNYIIFLIGMVAVIIVWAICNNNKSVYLKMAAAIVLFCVLYVIQSFGTKQFIENKTGCKMDSPMATLANVEMGLQTGGTRGPGWYNKYNDNTYIDAGGSTATQKEIAKQDLQATINEMKAHKGDTIRFFAEKTASQWLNPSFQALWTVQQTGSTKKNRPESAAKFIGPKNSISFTRVYSIIGFVFMAGLFLFACKELVTVFCGQETNLKIDPNGQNGVISGFDDISCLGRFLLEIIFIGGFIFYFLWEAKGQYTVVYMVMLCPLCMEGYGFLNELCDGYGKNVKILKPDKKQTVVLCSIGAICVLTIALSFVNVHFKNIIRLNDDTDVFYNEYKAFFYDKSEIDLTGKVSIVPASDENVMLANDGETIICVEQDSEAPPDSDGENDDKKGSLELISDGRTYRIRASKNKYFNGYLNDELSYNLEAGIRTENDGQFWRINKNDDGTVQIYQSSGYALAYDKDSGIVYLSEKSDSDQQKWLIRN